MAEFKNPYAPQYSEHPGCICGRHRSPQEHEHESRVLQCVPVARESRRYDGLIARETLRANFLQD